MSIDPNYTHIRSEAAKARVSPPDSAWESIQERLRKDRIKKPTKFWVSRNVLGIAAALFLLVMTYYIVQLNISHRYDLTHGKIAEWESLDISPDYFYSVKDVRALKQFYVIDKIEIIN
jgi:hypothetical protein